MNFNATRREAVFSGRLRVPGWGAYTQRTEFDYLTGVQAEMLGVNHQDPYLRYARREQWSIAQACAPSVTKPFASPFASSFFGRDQVIPKLGFDLFLDERFPGAARFASYVADQAIATRILSELDRDDRPKFIFAITVENHGQWRSDRLPNSRIEGIRRLVPELPGGSSATCASGKRGFDDRHASRGSGSQKCRALWLWRSPAELSSNFRERHFTDPRTDYFVWSPRKGRETVSDIAVEELAAKVIDAAGLQLLTGERRINASGTGQLAVASSHGRVRLLKSFHYLDVINAKSRCYRRNTRFRSSAHPRASWE